MVSITAEERKALFAKNGSRKVKCYANILKNGIVLSVVPCEGTVDLDTTADIERTAHLTLRNEFDWISIEIQPFMRIGKRDYPLGIFIPATPVKTVGQTLGVYLQVDCYDRTLMLVEDKLTKDTTFRAGERYLDVVKAMMRSAQIADIREEDTSELTLMKDRSFERGTSKLDIINTLLDEINFDKVRFDENGTALLSRYRLPEMNDQTIVYAADKESVLIPGYEDIVDYFNVPNVFFVDVDAPEAEASYHAEYSNNDLADPLSTVNRKRNIVAQLEGPESVSDQEQLDDWLERKVFELSSLYRTVRINTLAMPIHGAKDQVQLKTGTEIDGIYTEVAWNLALSSNGTMTHTLRRL